METTATQAAPDTDIDLDIKIPNAFLRGIPTSLLIDGTRERRIDEIDADLKLFMGNRHEHFRPLPETITIGDRELRVFEWTHSTFVAE